MPRPFPVMSALVYGGLVFSSLFILFGFTSMIYGLELTNLFFYMDVGPFILGLTGYSAVGLLSTLLRYVWERRNHALGVASLVAASAIVGYWHIPLNSPLGFGVCPADLTSPALYILRRITYALAGVLIYIGLNQFSPVFREAFAIGVGKAMGWYGLYLTLLDHPIYIAPPVYFTTGQHHSMGFAMLIMMVFLDFIAVTLLVNHFFKPHAGKTPPSPIVRPDIQAENQP
ncbi:MAG: hypothetical protein QXK39_01915 [Nitrososphaerota archaeon]